MIQIVLKHKYMLVIGGEYTVFATKYDMVNPNNFFLFFFTMDDI